jgi:hypothetical protein
VSAGPDRLDDALTLSRHAADLAGHALTLTRLDPDHDEPALAVADAIIRTAAAAQAVATTLLDRHLAARPADQQGHPQ